MAITCHHFVDVRGVVSYSPGAKVGIESWQVVDSGGLVVAEDDAVGSLEHLGTLWERFPICFENLTSFLPWSKHGVNMGWTILRNPVEGESDSQTLRWMWFSAMEDAGGCNSRRPRFSGGMTPFGMCCLCVAVRLGLPWFTFKVFHFFLQSTRQRWSECWPGCWLPLFMGFQSDWPASWCCSAASCLISCHYSIPFIHSGCW